MKKTPLAAIATSDQIVVDASPRVTTTTVPTRTPRPRTPRAPKAKAAKKR